MPTPTIAKPSTLDSKAFMGRDDAEADRRDDERQQNQRAVAETQPQRNPR